MLDPRVPGLVTSGPRLLLDGPEPHVKLVLEGKNGKPEGGLHFRYNASAQMSLERLDVAKRAASPSYSGFPAVGSCNPGQDIEEVQRCLNEMYAAKGYPFENSALKRQYYAGDPAFRVLDLGAERFWVRDASPLAGFSPAWFLSTEPHLIKQWTEAIARERGAATPEQPSANAAPRAAAEPPPVAPSEPSAAPKERENQAEPIPAPAPTPAANSSGPCACRVVRSTAAPSNIWCWLALLGGCYALRSWKHGGHRQAGALQRGIAR